MTYINDYIINFTIHRKINNMELIYRFRILDEKIEVNLRIEGIEKV